MPSESSVPISTGAGANVDVVTFSGVARQVVAIGDPSAQTAFAAVDASGALLVNVASVELLELILREQRRTNLLLAQAFGLDLPNDSDLEEGFSQ